MISSIVSATLIQASDAIRSPIKVLAVVLYSIVICLSLTGNISVIYILFKKIESKRVTSFMYVNLAVADLLVTFVVMPHQLQSILMETRWFGGVFGVCLAKFSAFTFFVALMASVYSLTAIAFDSFFSIVFSLREFPRFRSKKVLVPFIWLFSMFAMSPWLVIIKVVKTTAGHFMVVQEFSQLGDKKQAVHIYYLYIVAITYVLPLGITSFLYGYICQKLRSHTCPGVSVEQDKARLRMNKTKRQIIKMSIVVVVAFALSWLPVHICHVLFSVGYNWQFANFDFFMLVTYWCGHANSAVNPWLLIYFKRRFRAVFRKMITDPLSRLSMTSRAKFRSTVTSKTDFQVTTAF